jgi:homocysteine S-methyltransferase
MLADGSEYRGDYGLSVRKLRSWHRRRLDVLIDAEPDVLAIETIPCLAEVEALCAELDFPAWLSVTCSGTSTRAGEAARDAFAMARDCPAVMAVGVNCTDPQDVAALVRLAADVTGKPAVAYPNSGEGWDAERRAWTGRRGFTAEQVSDWVSEGARLIGGCCRIHPEDIARTSQLVANR